MGDRRDGLQILILNGDLPVFPGWGGIEHLHTTNLARLGQKVGLVSQVHTREQSEKKRTLTEAGVSLYLWENPGLNASEPGTPLHRPRFREMARSILKVIRYRHIQPQDTLIQDLVFRNISPSILKALHDNHWQILIVVQSNCSRWLDYLPKFPVSVLVLHDIRALVYERRAQIAASPVQRLTSLVEAWRYRRFERKYCRKYDLVVTVSKEDEAWVRKHYRPHNVVTIPIPVDLDYFTPSTSMCDIPGRILFTGMMNHPPNVDAACFFARHVFPRIREIIPEAEFWIVGRDPTPDVTALSILPGVVVTGYVSDIRPYIAQASLFVVPLRYGSGMRQKILEAWAMEKCVMSTWVGAEGLDYQDNLNILIADDAEAMLEQSVKALRDSNLRDRIRTYGRQLVVAQHHPAKLSEQYYRSISAAFRTKKRRTIPMKVAIDLRWMHAGVAGGIENLARSFLNHLIKIDGVNRYNVLLPVGARYDFDLRMSPNVRISVVDSPHQYWRKFTQRSVKVLSHYMRRSYWQSPDIELLRRVRKLNSEVALSIPGYIHPDFYPLLNVLVVPDIQHEYHPEFFSHQELADRRRIYTDSIKRADHLCAISDFTRQTLIERLGIPPDRVTTTHLAADPLFHPESPYRGKCRGVLKKYDLKAGEYLFFPGHTWQHKNHRAALQALAILRESAHLDPLLVCTGNPKEAHADLLNLIQELRLHDRVRFLGYCPMSDMPALYEGAAALVFPSFFEGFGIPLLEAMWCDCPIVCSNATSLPEVAGDAALFFDPHSPEELALAISRVLTDNHLRQTLIERGHQQSKEFSWHKFTTEIVRILHQVRESHYT